MREMTDEVSKKLHKKSPEFEDRLFSPRATNQIIELKCCLCGSRFLKFPNGDERVFGTINDKCERTR